jgi:hypothetical protein
MKTVSSKWRVLALVIGSAVAMGCSGASEPTGSGDPTSIASEPNTNGKAGSSPTLNSESTAQFALLTGHITDQGANLLSQGLAGVGSIVSATTMQVSQILPGGVLQVLGQTPIGPGGIFNMKLPLGLDCVVAQVLDATGHVIGSAIVFANKTVDGVLYAVAPITAQTSLQAQVLIAASGCSGNSGSACGPSSVPFTLPLSILALDVVADIDADLTAAVCAALAADAKVADLDLFVHAIAKATVSAARARLDVLAQAGVKLDLAACAKADLTALADLSAGLDAILCGKATLADVVAKFQADVEVALEATANVSVDVRVQAEIAASLTFCASLTASLASNATTDVDAIVFAAVHAVEKIEAKVVCDAIAQLIKVSGAAQTTIDSITSAITAFLGDVAAATNIPALSAARDAFVQALAAIPNLGGPLATLLPMTLSTAQNLVQSLLGTATNLVSKLDTDLKAKLDLVANVDVCVDAQASVNVDANVTAVATILAKFFADVNAAALVAPIDPVAQLGVKTISDVLAIAKGALRALP